MDIKKFELTGKSKEQIKTEIMFFVAAAKSKGCDLIKLSLKKQDDISQEEKLHSYVGAILKSIKREGIIQLYVNSMNFTNTTTEVEYLVNKYPNIDVDENADSFYIIKI